MTANLRTCTIEDLDDLREISARTFTETFAADNDADDFQAYLDRAYSEEELSSELRNPDSEFSFALVDGMPAGYLKLNVGPAQSESVDDQALEVERIYVLAASKGRGLGSLMLRHALEEAERRELSLVWLGVWEHNLSAQEFYRKRGFSVFGSYTFQIGQDAQTDLLMSRKLG